jgi:hypothetical protein
MTLLHNIDSNPQDRVAFLSIYLLRTHNHTPLSIISILSWTISFSYGITPKKAVSTLSMTSLSTVNVGFYHVICIHSCTLLPTASKPCPAASRASGTAASADVTVSAHRASAAPIASHARLRPVDGAVVNARVAVSVDLFPFSRRRIHPRPRCLAQKESANRAMRRRPVPLPPLPQRMVSPTRPSFVRGGSSL